MEKKEIIKVFEKDAENAAKKICGCGECFGDYDCGHPNKAKAVIPKLTKDTECPLAKYHIKPDGRTFYEKLKAGEAEPLDEDDLFAICACCEYTDGVTENGGSYELNRTEETFYKHCMDCPAHMAYEGIVETKAEAMMS